MLAELKKFVEQENLSSIIYLNNGNKKWSIF